MRRICSRYGLSHYIAQSFLLRCRPSTSFTSRRNEYDEDALAEAVRDESDKTTGKESNNLVCSTSSDHQQREVVWTDKAGVELANLASREIALEATRDEEDGMAALPPLIPTGWMLEHPPGTNYLLMHRKQDYRPLPERLKDTNGDDVHFLQPPAGKLKKKMMKKMSRGEEEGAGEGGELVTIYSPMRFKDPSFHEPTVDLCEWVPFDCLLRRPHASSLFLRLASVNSELRIRSVQHISRSAVAALGSHVAVFPSNPSTTPERLDVHRFGVQGDYLRTLLYPGPAMTDLSVEFREQLLNYITGPRVGVTAEVVEYICQMIYFAEQDEYMRWLGRLRQFASPSSSPQTRK